MKAFAICVKDNKLSEAGYKELSESYGDMFDPYNPEGHPEPETPTMSGSESANMLRKAVMKFVMDNPQLDNPKATVMAIVSELIK